MKPLVACVLGLFSFIAPVLGADAPLQRELKQLQEDRQKALAAAAEPVNRRYEASLQQLLRRAMQSNDLDTAVKIRAELQGLGATGGGRETVPSADLVGVWTFDGGLICDIKADGTLTVNGKPGKWSITERHLRIDHLNGNWERFTLPVRDGKLTGENDDGKKIVATRKK
jgi:hypothetical protein